MKLIVQIPAFNEASTIADAIAAIRRDVPGFDAVEVLVFDDGSADATRDAARRAGADHVVGWPKNRGLAQTFAAALRESLRRGADVIVNTDADNQYRAEDIPRLVEPIVAGAADIVVGARDMDRIPHFSATKRWLQRAGTGVVRRFSGADIADATSGFRAFSRQAAARLNVVSGYTYTLETLIQAGREGLAVISVPIETNPKTRESRLIRSNPQYIARSVGTILRIFVLYEPFRAFAAVGAALIAPAMILGLRFLYYYATEGGRGHVQSLILAAVLAIVGFQVVTLGVVADLLAANRRFLTELLESRRYDHRDDA
ncbi:glycosyltransferase family 2 protein [bacterium]|nr:glycosyltransferase family 2 protein [bacterium]